MKSSFLQWSTDDFERMRGLDRSAYINAVFNLGHASLNGSKQAIDSLLNALPVARPMDWLESAMCSHEEVSQKVTLIDGFGLALVNHLPDLSEDLIRVLECTFKTSGKWEFQAPKSFSNRKDREPLHQLAGYAMAARHDASRISAFLRPIADAIDQYTEAAVCVDLRAPGNKLSGAQFYDPSSLHTHAALNANVQAVKALKEVLPIFAKSMLEVTPSAKASNGYSQSARGSSMEVAAKGSTGDTIALMLDQLRASADETTFFDEVASALLIHVKQSGFNKDPQFGTHDSRLGVFRAIMAHGGEELLSRYDGLLDKWASNNHKEGDSALERAEKNALVARIKKLETIAANAIVSAHPEAIFAFRHIIERSRHLTDQDRDNKQLINPLESLIGYGETYGSIGNAKTRLKVLDYDRVLDAYSPGFLNAQLALYGEDILLGAAKAQKVDLAMNLVKRGVDPMAKNDNGWKAESHFKDEAKVQWRAFAASHKAMSAVNSLLGNLDTVLPRAAAGSHP